MASEECGRSLRGLGIAASVRPLCTCSPDRDGNFYDDPVDNTVCGERIALHFTTAHWPRSGN